MSSADSKTGDAIAAMTTKKDNEKSKPAFWKEYLFIGPPAELKAFYSILSFLSIFPKYGF